MPGARETTEKGSMRSMRFLAVALCLLGLACSDGRQTAGEGGLSVAVVGQSGSDRIERVDIVLLPQPSGVAVHLPLQAPADPQDGWSQLIEVPLGTFTARAEAFDVDDELLFASDDSSPFQSVAGQTVHLQLTLVEQRENDDLLAPYFISVALGGNLEVGRETEIVVRGGGGDGVLQLSATGDGSFGPPSGDPYDASGVTLGWTPVLGANELELLLTAPGIGSAKTTLTVHAACPQGFEACDGSCVDTQTDPEYCGGCVDSACSPGEDCEDGVCVEEAPVPPGVYAYEPVVWTGLVNPMAGAWHPSGEYALVASYTNQVFKYDPVAQSIIQVGTAGSSFYWTGIEFTEDGDYAALVGYQSGNGRIYVWDHAASTLAEMTSERASGISYRKVKRSPEGELWVMGTRESPRNVLLWPFDPMTGRGSARASWSAATCEDMAFATDAQGRRAIAVVCGINGVDLRHLDGEGTWVQGNTAGLGNTSRIDGRPQGDYALAIAWTSSINSIHRFEQGDWIRNQGGWLPGAYRISFSPDEKRALVLADRPTHAPSEGRVYEFRHDLLTNQEIKPVHIPNMNGSPYAPTSSVINLNEALWHPVCDGGIILAGKASSPTNGYIIRFEILNGDNPCP